MFLFSHPFESGDNDHDRMRIRLKTNIKEHSMKRKTLSILAALLMSITTVTAYAGMNTGSMDMKSGDQIMLPSAVSDGVSAMVHLKDIKDAMSKMGMDTTHHFMIMLTDRVSREKMREGTVALKIIRPNGHTDKPIKLMSMSDAFGTDIAINDKGTYTFVVGTKLSDDKKRTFTFKYTVK